MKKQSTASKLRLVTLERDREQRRAQKRNPRSDESSAALRPLRSAAFPRLLAVRTTVGLSARLIINNTRPSALFGSWNSHDSQSDAPPPARSVAFIGRWSACDVRVAPRVTWLWEDYALLFHAHALNITCLLNFKNVFNRNDFLPQFLNEFKS